MNNFHFLYPKRFLGPIISLFMIISPCGFSQTTSSILTQQELDAINKQPIAPKVSAADRVLGAQKRDKSFSYEGSNGTQVDEFRDVGQNVEIQVDSSMGTHYEMSPLLSRDSDATRQVINRLPSVSVPF